MGTAQKNISIIEDEDETRQQQKQMLIDGLLQIDSLRCYISRAVVEILARGEEI